MMINKTRTFGVEKFDVVVMNPPYQIVKDGNKMSNPIWHLFIKKIILNILKEDGYLNTVHPSGWRNVDGVFKDIQLLLRDKQLLYLEIHNEKDGLKTFGAETRYDFYCVKNIDNKGSFITKIKCQGGKIERVNISKMEFIPNGMFEQFNKLLAKPGEEKVEVLYSRSDYGTDKKNMSKEQTDEFKFPIVYTVKKGDIITTWYSSVNSKGHFNVPKLIWSNFSITSAGSIIDLNGDYGLTQFAYAIIDDVNDLANIKKAFDSKKFRDLMEYCTVSTMSINHKVIALFRKDFWVDFLDYNNDDE